MQEIAPGVHVETAHLGSNNAIVTTGEGVVLIDAPHRPTDAVRCTRRRSASALTRDVCGSARVCGLDRAPWRA